MELKHIYKIFIAYGLAFVSVAMQAMGTTSVQLLGGAMPDMELNIWRFLAQFLLTTIGVSVTRQDLRVQRQHWLQLGLITVILWANNMCYFSMPKYLPVGTLLGLYTGFCVCATGVLACFKKTLTAAVAVSVLLSLLGALFLTQPLVIFKNSGLFRHVMPNWTSACWNEVLPQGQQDVASFLAMAPISTTDVKNRTYTKKTINNRENNRENLLDVQSLANLLLNLPVDKMASRIWIASFPNNTQSSQSNRIYSLRRSPETPAQPVAVYDIDYSEFKISNKDVGNATYTDFFRIPLFFNETWKGYLFLLGSVGTVTIGMQLTRSLQDHVDSMVVIFWAAFFSLILAAITSGISERMVLFRGSYCILVVTLHAIGSGVNSTAVIWLMKYMQPVTCALTWNLELVFLMAFQYTFMSSVNPGLGNWLEIVGAVVCFLACTIGPLSELIVEWQESNKQGYEDLDAEQLDGSRINDK